MSADFVVRIAKQALLDWHASRRPLDRIVNEALREHRVGARQRHEVSDLIFRAVRFWPLLVGARFNPEEPAQMRDFEAALRALPSDAAAALALHERAKPKCDANLLQHLLQVHGLPEFLREEIALNPQDWHDCLHASLREAPLSLRVNTLKNSREQVLAELAPLNAQAGAAPDAVRLPARTALQRHPLLGEGRAEVQDENSQQVALTLAPQAGEHVLDLCAGAGGKTLHMAALMGNKGEIVATDMDPKKLLRLQERARLAGATNIRTVRPEKAAEDLRGNFDAVLIDAPCSGLGTLRRNPERIYGFTANEARELARVQSALLERGAAQLKSGGRLLYATCTFRKAENEDILALAPASLKLEKTLRLAPRQDSDADGFFIGLLRKVP